jgi:hypothetical protein
MSEINKNQSDDLINDPDIENDSDAGKSTITYKCEKCEKNYKNKYRYKNHSCKKDDNAIINSLFNSISARITDNTLKATLIEKIVETFDKSLKIKLIRKISQNLDISEDIKIVKKESQQIDNNKDNNGIINLHKISDVIISEDIKIVKKASQPIDNKDNNGIINLHKMSDVIISEDTKIVEKTSQQIDNNGIINLCNISDTIEDKDLLDKIISDIFIKKYVTKMKRLMLDLTENADKRNKIDIDDYIAIAQNDLKHNMIIDEINDIIFNTCIYFFGKVYFSRNELSKNVIYVSTLRLQDSFYIYEKNKWKKQGNINLLSKIVTKIYETYTKKCEELGYGMINKISHNFFYNKKVDKKIATKLRIYAYENRHVVKEIFDNTFEMKKEKDEDLFEELFEECIIDEDDKIKFANEMSEYFEMKKSKSHRHDTSKNYSNGKIYLLSETATKKPFYLGSTVRELNIRKDEHLYRAGANDQRLVYKYIRHIGCSDNSFYIELYENYSCANAHELYKREGEITRLLLKNGVKLTNMIISGKNNEEDKYLLENSLRYYEKILQNKNTTNKIL